MGAIVLRQTLRASWRHLLYWALAMAMLNLYISFIGSSSDIVAGYANLMQGMPESVASAFGADAQMMSTQEGFILAIAAGQGALILMAQAVMAGFSIVSNDENAGILDMVLALPISRTRYMLERGLAWMLITLVIILACCVAPIIVLPLLGVDADVGVVITGLLNIYPGLLLVMVVSGLFAVLIRRRSVAIGAAAAFVVGSYIFNVIGAAASGAIADLLHSLSYFRIISAETVANGTYNPTASLGLIVIALALFGASIVAFNRRDIGI